uniref:Uncharacterized protein n=1 Tax=Arundo donax TaxID=35708 RepID=A0A0A9C000_ARUDO
MYTIAALQRCRHKSTKRSKDVRDSSLTSTDPTKRMVAYTTERFYSV